jgi:hypothetical protein
MQLRPEYDDVPAMPLDAEPDPGGICLTYGPGELLNLVRG